jgi:hypothetical protein
MTPVIAFHDIQEAITDIFGLITGLSTKRKNADDSYTLSLLIAVASSNHEQRQAKDLQNMQTVTKQD